MTKVISPVTTFDAKYDAWNRLVKLTDGPSHGYRYDGLGRRVQKVLPNTSTTIEYYYNQGWQLLEERRSSSSFPQAQYVWHPYYIDASSSISARASSADLALRNRFHLKRLVLHAFSAAEYDENFPCLWAKVQMVRSLVIILTNA